MSLESCGLGQDALRWHGQEDVVPALDAVVIGPSLGVSLTVQLAFATRAGTEQNQRPHLLPLENLGADARPLPLDEPASDGTNQQARQKRRDYE